MTVARSDYRAFLDYLDRIEAESIHKPVEAVSKPQSRIVAERIIAEIEQVGRKPIVTEQSHGILEHETRHIGAGIIRAVGFSLLVWVPAIIWAIAHYAQKAGAPW